MSRINYLQGEYSRTSGRGRSPSSVTRAQRCIAGLAKFGPSAVLSQCLVTEQMRALREQTLALLADAFEDLPARLVLGGSSAKGTDMPGNASDVDVVLLYSDFERAQYEEYLRQVEGALMTLDVGDVFVSDLRRVDAHEYGPRTERLGNLPPASSRRGRALTKKHTWHITGRLEFVELYQGHPTSCRFDVLVGKDLPAEADIVELLIASSASERSSLNPSLVERHVAFIKNEPQFIKDAVKLVKWWKYQVLQVQLGGVQLRSFLIELLVMHAAHTQELDDALDIFKEVLEMMKRWKVMRIVWDWGELLDAGRFKIRDKNPFVLDPVNPTNNVAQTVSRWSDLASVAADTLSLLTSSSSRMFNLAPQLCCRPWNALHLDKGLVDGIPRNVGHDVLASGTPPASGDENWEDPSEPAAEEGEDLIFEGPCDLLGMDGYISDEYGEFGDRPVD